MYSNPSRPARSQSPYQIPEGNIFNETGVESDKKKIFDLFPFRTTLLEATFTFFPFRAALFEGGFIFYRNNLFRPLYCFVCVHILLFIVHKIVTG